MLILLPVATGCSDDVSPSETPPPAPTSSSSPAEAPQEDAPADSVAAQSEIKKNWATFFDPKASADDKVKVLQNGDAMRPLIAAFAGDPNAAKSAAKVTDVEFTSATEADVTYDLLVGGKPALPDSKGTSVHQDEVWKVSVKTLCALVQLSGNASAPGC